MNLRIRSLTNKSLNKLATGVSEEREGKPGSGTESGVGLEKESQGLAPKVVSGSFECWPQRYERF